MLAQRLLFLPKHPFAGAGGIHQNLVKKLRKRIRHMRSVLVQHPGVENSHSFQIVFQDLRTRGHILIGNQKSLSLQTGTQLTGFSARCGTQVQNPISRLNIQKSLSLIHI